MADLLTFTGPENTREENRPQVTVGGTQGIPAADLDTRARPPAEVVRQGQTAPDTVARNRLLGKWHGVDRENIEADPQAFEVSKRNQELNQITAEAPVLGQWFGDTNNAALAHDDAEQLGSFERIWRGLQTGIRQTELGQSQFRAIGLPADSPQQQEANRFATRLNELGVDPGTGVTSFFVSAAKIVGQQLQTLNSPEATVRIGGGLAMGAGAGAAMGLGVGSGPGAIIGGGTGATAGFISNAAIESFENEAAFMYSDLVEAGMDRESAALPSYTIGVVNAALEMGGLAAVLKPITGAGSKIIRNAITRRLTTPANLKLAKQFIKDYGVAVLAETGTEVLQEVTAIAMQNFQAMQDSDITSVSPEEAAERIADVAEEVFKGMVVLGAPGATANLVASKSQAAKSDEFTKKLDEAHVVAQESKLAQRDQDKFGEVAGQQMAVGGQPDVFVDAGAMWQWINETAGSQVLTDLGISVSDLADARASGLDIRIPSDRLAATVLPNPDLYTTLRDHIREDSEGMSAAEAQEFRDLGLDTDSNTFNSAADIEAGEQTSVDPTVPENQVDQEFNQMTKEVAESDLRIMELLDENDPGSAALKKSIAKAVENRKKNPEQAQAVDIAEAELGLQAMFNNAQEAGMTQAEYIKYLASVQKKVDDAVDRQVDKELKAEQTTLTKEYKTELEKTKESVRESLATNDTYSSFQGVQRDRLDHATVAGILKDIDPNLTIEDLPTQKKKRRVVTKKGEKGGLDPEIHAELYGYASAQEMITDWVTAVPFEEAVVQTAEQQQTARAGTLFDRLSRVAAAREDLFNDTQTAALVQEFNALKDAKKNKRLTQKLVRRAAKNQFVKLAFKDVQPRRFQANVRRLGQQARRALRKGDRETAANFKYQQVLNVEMGRMALIEKPKMQKAIRNVARLSKPNSKRAQKIPVQYQRAIQDIASKYLLSNRRPKDESSAARAIENKEIDPVRIPTNQKFTNDQIFWQDANIGELESLVDTVKELAKKGRDDQKYRDKAVKDRLQEEAQTVVEAVDSLANLRPRKKVDTREWFDRARKGGREIMGLVLNADSVLRDIDNFQDFGPVHDLIKGRHDRARNQGVDGKGGWLKRNRTVEQEIVSIYDKNYTRKEQAVLMKRVPGLPRSLRKHESIMAVMQWGNPEGREAMRNAFTPQEMDKVINSLTPKDVAFINDMLSYLDGYFKEISDKEAARSNIQVVKVEALPIETSHGTITGGYVPLRYEQNASLSEEVSNIKELEQLARFGAFASSHTARWHTLTRQANRGKVPHLNLNIITAHLGQVVWDLEMGDAFSDIFKLWNQKEVKQSLEDAGYGHYHSSIQMWIRDTMVGEISGAGIVQQALRWVRVGTVISALGWNINTIMLQPLGLVVTAAELGKFETFKNMEKGLVPKFRNEVYNMSEAMRERADAHNQDIALIRDRLKGGVLSRVIGKGGERFFRDGSLLLIKKAQSYVDIVTWSTAYNQAMRENNNSDQQQAIEFADQMVSRTQGSPIFGQRTAFERGSLTLNKQQSELVRQMTPFISYFINKNNVAWEKFKKTNFKNPAQFLDFVSDMALLYVVEAMFIVMVHGTEEDEHPLKAVARESAFGFVAGVPIIREMVSSARGFPGGILQSTGKDLGDMWTALGKAFEEGDFEDIRKPAIKLLFTFSHIGGGSQINKILDAAQKDQTRKVTIDEYMFGVDK